MMCGCSSLEQPHIILMLDVSAAILDNRFKTSTPFIDTVISETSFCHSVTIARFSYSTVLNCRWW